MPKFMVGLEGFPTEIIDAPNAEAAWDAYKVKDGGSRRRTKHDKAPVITEVEIEPELAAELSAEA